MKKVVFFIKWRSDEDLSVVFQYYVPEYFRDKILSFDFSYAVSFLVSLAFDPDFFLRESCSSLLIRFSLRLLHSFKRGWHIEAFSIYKKSLL